MQIRRLPKRYNQARRHASAGACDADSAGVFASAPAFAFRRRASRFRIVFHHAVADPPVTVVPDPLMTCLAPTIEACDFQTALSRRLPQRPSRQTMLNTLNYTKSRYSRKSNNALQNISFSCI